MKAGLASVLAAALLAACAVAGPLTKDDYRYLEAFGIDPGSEVMRCGISDAQKKQLHELINRPDLAPKTKHDAVNRYLDTVLIEVNPALQLNREDQPPCR